MPTTVFDIKGVPGARRERIEAAAVAGGRHTTGPHEAWIAGGFCDAISGPVSRGDDAIVEGQRRAIETHDPSLLPLFDALTATTRREMKSCA